MKLETFFYLFKLLNHELTGWLFLAKWFFETVFQYTEQSRKKRDMIGERKQKNDYKDPIPHPL